MLSLTSSSDFTLSSVWTPSTLIIWYPKELLTGAETSPSFKTLNPAKKSVSKPSWSFLTYPKFSDTGLVPAALLASYC